MLSIKEIILCLLCTSFDLQNRDIYCLFHWKTGIFKSQLKNIKYPTAIKISMATNWYKKFHMRSFLTKTPAVYISIKLKIM